MIGARAAACVRRTVDRERQLARLEASGDALT
jgi:hypothetical protein